MKGITVHPFRVIPDHEKAAPLEKILDAVAKTPLDKRMRLCSSSSVRIEDIKKGPDGCYLMDFARLRFEGAPGKGSNAKATEDIDFGVDGGASEETAALYDPSTKHLLVQYNHNGARSARIAEYLSNFDDVAENLYQLEARFEANIEQRLAQKQIIKAIRFRIRTDAVSAVDKAHGTALTSVVDPARDIGAEYIEMMLNAKRIRDSGLNRAGFNKLVRWVTRRMGVDQDSVTMLKVSGKVDADDKAETINLLGNRLAVTFNDLKVGPGLRYPRAARWNALIRARSGWAKQLR